MPTRTVQFQNLNIVYELERKSVKNVNLRVRSDGSVYVCSRGIFAFVYFLGAEKKIVKPVMITAIPANCCREMLSLKMK